jgi:CheY-like chemotaxis protein
MEKKKILSIEDNSANRKIIHDLLTIRGGYEVIEAVDGKEGLKKVESDKPDLILVDIQLPVMDGLEVTRNIRKHPDPAINQIPIIIITSYAMAEKKKKGFEAGCSAYLAKPLNLKELMETINKFFKK